MAVFLSSNIFRRVLHLAPPITISTVISWILTPIGVYQIANISTNNWLSDTSPRPSTSFSALFYDLFYSIYQTWTEASNYYDRNLWCMMYILQGSLTLYFFLLATSGMKPMIRMLLAAILLIWSWRKTDGTLLCLQ